MLYARHAWFNQALRPERPPASTGPGFLSESTGDCERLCHDIAVNCHKIEAERFDVLPFGCVACATCEF